MLPYLSRMVFICFCLAAWTTKLAGLPGACFPSRGALKAPLVHDLTPCKDGNLQRDFISDRTSGGATGKPEVKELLTWHCIMYAMDTSKGASVVRLLPSMAQACQCASFSKLSLLLRARDWSYVS